MKFEHPLDRRRLSAAISNAYTLEVCEITFIPQGEVGQHYRVDCVDRRSYFLTWLGNQRLAHLAVARACFYLTLTAELYERGLFRQLAPPIRTRAGDLKIEFDGGIVILYPYIAGKNLLECPVLPANLIGKMAGLIARLHSISAQIQVEIPYVERFSIPFEPALRDGLAALEGIKPACRPGEIALRDLLLPRRTFILSLLDRLHDLAGQAARDQPELVLCHTDANQANLILTDGDELILVDWEGAMLAPAEHDLFIFTGDEFPEFLRHYCLARPQVKLSAERFAFYFYRRNLEDLTDWIIRILFENTLDEQDGHDLEGIRQDCVAGWDYLEEGIHIVRTQLQACWAKRV